MHISSITLFLASGLAVRSASCTVKAAPSSSSAAANSSASLPGYDGPGSYIPSTVSGNTLSFGQHYAVLNLDLINGLVGSVASSTQGQAFIKNTRAWIDTVHAQVPPPLSIFTRIYFANARKPEIKPGGGFSKVSAGLTTADDPKTQIYPAFTVDSAAGDVVLQKTGYYAGTGNELENILCAQSIDTVILSGIRTSGVILSTTYRLFDLGYKVYIIANNSIETPPQGTEINNAILDGIIPKIPGDVITVEQAIAALARSGPAVY
ncbi:hypothetical protein AMS68_004645 [Peltaster fructicola]|uniref:Isochorismatase-like domain-containing protein n=1 Tax=Peltaster fructicola TaxID=286661 RepID=A0A6H0XX04_9PEZI|nr:hypothetical protein AMS68_004645 [Peltaster fructicola]